MKVKQLRPCAISEDNIIASRGLSKVLSKFLNFLFRNYQKRRQSESSRIISRVWHLRADTNGFRVIQSFAADYKYPAAHKRIELIGVLRGSLTVPSASVPRGNGREPESPVAYEET